MTHKYEKLKKIIEEYQAQNPEDNTFDTRYAL